MSEMINQTVKILGRQKAIAKSQTKNKYPEMIWPYQSNGET